MFGRILHPIWGPIKSVHSARGGTWAKHHSVVVSHCACRAAFNTTPPPASWIQSANVMNLSQRMWPSPKQRPGKSLCMRSHWCQPIAASSSQSLGFCRALWHSWLWCLYFPFGHKESWLLVEDEDYRFSVSVWLVQQFRVEAELFNCWAELKVA